MKSKCDECERLLAEHRDAVAKLSAALGRVTEAAKAIEVVLFQRVWDEAKAVQSENEGVRKRVLAHLKTHRTVIEPENCEPKHHASEG
jgi:hypothetical protein